MTLPTPTYQFFTTENVLHDTISGTEKLVQRNLAHPIQHSTIQFGTTLNAMYCPNTSSTQQLVGIDSAIINATSHTVSFIVSTAPYPNRILISDSMLFRTRSRWNFIIDSDVSSLGNRIGLDIGTFTSTLPPTVPMSDPVLVTLVTKDNKSYSYVNGVYNNVLNNSTISGSSGFLMRFPGREADNSGVIATFSDFRVYNAQEFTDEQVAELYDSYFPPPTPPTSLVITPTYLYPDSTITATGSGSDSEVYHYEFYNETDAELLQDYSINNTYSLNNVLKHKNIRISVKAYSTRYSDVLSTTKFVYNHENTNP